MNQQSKNENNRVKDNEQLIELMESNVTTLQNTIRYMKQKRGKIFLDWLEIQNKYLNYELTFDPMRMKAYKRGEVVMLHFGFNVGNEFGGIHYAVVIKDSSKGDYQAVVVPLSSLNESMDEKAIHSERVLLGVIDGLNSKRSVAIPNQIRSVSKLRITKPRTEKDKEVYLTDAQLDILDAKIIELYTKNR